VGGLPEDESASVACRSVLDLQRPRATSAAFERRDYRLQKRKVTVAVCAVPAIHSLHRHCAGLSHRFSATSLDCRVVLPGQPGSKR
jgi:hypothetical protein